MCLRGTDQFEEVNTSPADAVRIGDGFNAELTLCGSEDDWFVLNVAELTVAELRFNTEDDGGLAVDILDSDLAFLKVPIECLARTEFSSMKPLVKSTWSSARTEPLGA